MHDMAIAQVKNRTSHAPIFSAGTLTIEKEQRTLQMLLTSLLSVGEIWLGKFISAMLFLTQLLVSSLLGDCYEVRAFPAAGAKAGRDWCGRRRCGCIVGSASSLLQPPAHLAG